MNEPSPDEDLKALFARQRNADRQRSPAFPTLRTGGVVSRPATPRWLLPTLWHWAWPGLAVLVLGLVAVFSLHRAAPPATVSRDALVRQLDEIDAALQRNLAAQHALTAWQSPTDFLLEPINHQNIP